MSMCLSVNKLGGGGGGGGGGGEVGGMLPQEIASEAMFAPKCY